MVVMRYVVEAEGLESVGLWSMTAGLVAFLRSADLTGAGGLARMLATSSDDPYVQAQYVDTMSVIVFLFYASLCAGGYEVLRYLLLGSVPSTVGGLANSLLLWGLICLPLSAVGTAKLSAIDGLGRADIRSLLNIGGYLLFLCAALFFLEEHGIKALAYAQFAQFVLVICAARAVLVASIESLVVIPSKLSRRAARACLGYGSRLQLMSLPMAIFDPLARVLVGRWGGLEVLGFYELSYKFASQGRQLIQSYFNPLIPQFTKLWISDREKARLFFRSINHQSLLIVPIGFGLLVLLSPLVSILVLSEISAMFILSTSIFSLSWGIASFGLVTHLLARAAGVLRWSILGQMLIIICGPPLMYLIAHYVSQMWVAVGAAVAIALGHAAAFMGEARALDVNPKRSGSSLFAIASFFVLALIAILLSNGQVNAQAL